jgi:UDP-N-acetylmuramate--alanine ligase
MMNFEEKQNIYFIGIGGIGMSALAKYFHALGKNVSGYDLTSSSITDEIRKLGIKVHFSQDITCIPERFLDISSTLVVRTPAVPEDHEELQYFLEHNFLIMKRAEVLGHLVNGKRGIAIAGTHGKTSVSSMLAYIMHESVVGCSAFLGGIMKNYSSNLIVDDRTEWIVTEADEFDRSFLHLTPEIALITWIDSDHLDIYSTKDEIRKSFESFASGVKNGGTIVLKKGIEVMPEGKNVRSFTYSLDDPTADFYACEIQKIQDKYRFNIHTPDKTVEGITLSYPGITNIENAVAATSVAWLTGIDEKTISSTLSSFQGVKRRFDIQYRNDRCVYIDDYAHHPRELDAFIGSVKKLYPGKKITGIFQPHLYSRTRDFAGEFAESLSTLDELLLLDIYPAREKPIKGVSSEIIFDKVTSAARSLISKDDLMSELKEKDFEILLTMGAGDIDRFVEPIKQLLKNR